MVDFPEPVGADQGNGLAGRCQEGDILDAPPIAVLLGGARRDGPGLLVSQVTQPGLRMQV